jgi:hypothetical protein
MITDLTKMATEKSAGDLGGNSRLGIGVNRWFVVVQKPIDRVYRCWTRTEVGNPRLTEVCLLVTR